MADLPETATWHPLDAARVYEMLAEEACGKAAMAFSEYARLRGEYVKREQGRNGSVSVNDLMFKWKSHPEALSCASDLATYSNLAQMYAAMATMKHTRAAADPKLLHEAGRARHQL